MVYSKVQSTGYTYEQQGQFRPLKSVHSSDNKLFMMSMGSRLRAVVECNPYIKNNF